MSVDKNTPAGRALHNAIESWAKGENTSREYLVTLLKIMKTDENLVNGAASFSEFIDESEEKRARFLKTWAILGRFLFTVDLRFCNSYPNVGEAIYQQSLSKLNAHPAMK